MGFAIPMALDAAYGTSQANSTAMVSFNVATHPTLAPVSFVQSIVRVSMEPNVDALLRQVIKHWFAQGLSTPFNS